MSTPVIGPGPRVRIRTTKPAPGCLTSGADVEVVAVGEDGTEVLLPARSVAIYALDPSFPISARIELVNVELDVEATPEMKK